MYNDVIKEFFKNAVLAKLDWINLDGPEGDMFAFRSSDQILRSGRIELFKQ